MKRSRVLVVAPTPEGANTGLSIAVRCLLDGLEQRGLDYMVADTTWGGIPEQPGRGSVARALASVVVAIVAVVKTIDCRYVYITLSTSKGGFLRGAAPIFFASLLGRRIIAHLHGGGFREFYDEQGSVIKTFIRWIMGKTTRIVALGELLVEQFAVVPAYETKVVVIPNGFPANQEVPEARQRELNPAEPLRVLYLSNLVPSKGVLYLLAAIERLLADSRRVEVDIAGSHKDAGGGNEIGFSTFVADFEAACRRLGPSCRYHGAVFGEAKAALFEQSHVFCLPTHYPWEGQPISIIEALAYGLPVISTAHKGIPEQVIDGKNGRLVPPRSAEAIAEALVELIDCPGQYQHFSVEARAHFEENFTREIHQERLVNCILGNE